MQTETGLPGGIRPIPVVSIPVKMVNAFGVNQRGSALDAVDLVTLAQQVFGQVGTVLTGDAGNQGFAGGHIY
jgi:hypothetical protein